MDAKTDPSNPVLVETLDALQKADGGIYDTAEQHLGKTNRERPEVNISDIERQSEEGDTILVPGKILGSGKIDNSATVAAFKASDSAKAKIENAGGEFVYIQDLLDENQQGSGVKIVV